MDKRNTSDGTGPNKPTQPAEERMLFDVSGYPAKGTLLALRFEHPPNLDAWRARRCVEELAACEQAYHAGVVEAVSEAMLVCEYYGCSPPRWLVDAVIKLVNVRTTPAERNARREAMLHYERYGAVQELWERTLDGETFGGERLRNMDDVYAVVAEHYGVSDKSIQRSYLIVKNDIEAGHGAKYFQTFCRHF
jgi:hypothetical protein